MEVVYEVRIAGMPTDSWSDWFPGVRIEHGIEPNGFACTVLFVPGRDVSLLHGVLAQIGNLNLCLVSVKRIERRKT
jgi:hypothetical protein